MTSLSQSLNDGDHFRHQHRQCNSGKVTLCSLWQAQSNLGFPADSTAQHGRHGKLIHTSRPRI